MPDVASFLEVHEGRECVVVLSGQRYDLGYVQRVYFTHPTYIVWGDQEQKIWYEIDHSVVTLTPKFHAFWVRCNDLLCRSLHNLRRHQKTQYHGMLAASISSALESEFKHADASLESARDYLSTANERTSKGRYILGVLGTVVLACIASYVLDSLASPAPTGLTWLLTLALAGGAIGAFLSALSGEIRDVRFDPNATAAQGYMNGSLRVLYGICGAFVVVVGVKSGVVSSSFITADNEALALLCVAFGGGFAERQAANIIKRLSSDRSAD